MNKTGKTAVVSIYPGIRDIIWHLPFFRALAEKSNTLPKQKVQISNKYIYLQDKLL